MSSSMVSGGCWSKRPPIWSAVRRVVYARSVMDGDACTCVMNRSRVHAYLGAQAVRTTQLVVRVRRDNPHPPKGSTIVLPISAASAAFQDYADLVRVIFHDPSLRVTYAFP